MAPHLDIQANGRPLDPGARLWRYMKLSTFLYMLTKERVFIPRLSTLQNEDKFEGQVDLQDGQPTKSKREQALKTWEAWFRRAKDDGGTTEPWEKSSGPSLSDLWLRELAKRRLVWCWHQSENESMAQWVIYGREAGVAIRSDVESVLRAFGSANVVFGEVQYVHPGRLPEEASPDLAWHPYFLKHGSYQHENEVRFVLAEDPEWSEKGRTIKISPGNLIQEIVISPLIQREEATATLYAVVQLCEKHHIQNIRISGGKDVYNPHGRSDSTPEERGLDLVNDEWLKNGSQQSEGEPLILSLTSPIE